MSKLQVSNNMLDKIRSIGYKPYNIVTDDGYFVFNLGENSVTNFKIKGLYGWKFGIWVCEEDKDSYIQIFAQHRDNIDKFKPSRSVMLVTYSKQDYDYMVKGEYFHIISLKQMLGMIKRHPLISYRYDAIGYADYYYKSFVLSYLQDKIELNYKKLKDFTLDFLIYNYTKIKTQLCKSNKVLESIKLVDRNIDGWIHCPRFCVDIVFKDGLTDNEEIEFLDKWFKTYYYHNMKVEHKKVNSGYYQYEIE